MAQIYTPYQNRTTTAQPSASGSPPITGRGTQAGAAPTNANQVYGDRLTVNGIGDPGWGTGITFMQNSKIAALNALKNGMSTANPEDYAGMDEMRNYYRGALGDLASNPGSSFNPQATRALANNSSLLRDAGGSMGSSGYAGAYGDSSSRANTDYLNGLINARADALTQSGKINTGLGTIQNQDLNERKFQQAQGQSLSDQILKLMGIDQSRENALAASDAQAYANKMGILTGIISPLASYGGGQLANSNSEKQQDADTNAKIEKTASTA